MLYDLGLRIAFAYEPPVRLSRHLLRVFPRDIPGVQRAIATDLAIDPLPEERSVFTDAFGNRTQDVFLRNEHARLDIRLTSRVERHAPPAPPAAGPLMEELPAALEATHALDGESPHHFIGPSQLIRPSPEAAAFARGVVHPGAPCADAVRALGQALHAAMTFDPGATEVDTPYEEAFARRRGVCQDFTHIMIACLRGVGVPAAYVSGFIRTIPPPGQERLAGADAMHAWVRAWCGPNLGWIEYDPTNAVDVAEQHVVVAYGRDYFDVAPTKGVLRTAGAHEASLAVDLTEAVAR
ncbi:MAG: transglutaminase family protein [Hyphomonadaceae bacterium]|nr:transglutaminase family protein [Hyphomonadaceae bacterium]